MKVSLAGACFVLMTLGCKESQLTPTEVGLGDRFQLKYGESVFVPSALLTLTFKALGEDSRCPEGAICIWQGNARVVVSVSGVDTSLYTTIGPKEFVTSGFKIQLLAVDPYPKMNEQHKPEEYVIALVITKQE